MWDAQKCAANLVQLLETDVLGVLPEALKAHVQAVLPDLTVSVGAGATSVGALSIIARPEVVDFFETHDDAEPLYYFFNVNFIYNEIKYLFKSNQNNREESKKTSFCH